MVLVLLTHPTPYLQTRQLPDFIVALSQTPMVLEGPTSLHLLMLAPTKLGRFQVYLVHPVTHNRVVAHPPVIYRMEKEKQIILQLRAAGRKEKAAKNPDKVGKPNNMALQIIRL